MANRLTLMDGELTNFSPTPSQTRQGRFPVRIPLPVEPPPRSKQQHVATSSVPATDNESAMPKKPSNEKSIKYLSEAGVNPYYPFMSLDQAGPAVIARDNADRSFVAIKRVKKTGEKNKLRIPDFVSDHVVAIKDIFLEKEEVVIIYEQMDVSLKHIVAVTGGPLQAFEVATICKEVIEGLTYIHERLAMYHGNLSCGTVLLRQDGKIKIGKVRRSKAVAKLTRVSTNIADSVLQRKVISSDKADTDIKCIGNIMMELMEPGTSILDPQTTTLAYPEKWKDGLGIKDFLAATQHSVLSSLKKASKSFPWLVMQFLL